MSFSNHRRTLISAAAFAVSATLLAATQTSAAVLTYDANTTPPVNDGTGVWDTATTNWFDGTNDVVWANTTSDTAIFGTGGTIANAAAGTVTVGTVNVGTITFNPTLTAGYTLNGGMITLGSGINGNQTGSTLTSNIGSVIAGANGLVFVGTASSTVSLNGANTYSGITTVSTAGRLQLNNVSAAGATTGATAATLGTDYTQVNNGSTAVVATNTSEAFVINGTGQSFAGSLRINNSPTLSSLVQLGSASTILNNGGGGVTLNGNINTVTFAVTLQSFAAVNATVANGDIAGSGSLTLQGSTGPIVLNGNKSYTGATTVGGAAANSGLLAGSGNLMTSTATVAVGGTIAPSTAAGAVNTLGTFGLTGSGAGTSGNLVLNGTYVADLTAASSDLITINNALTLGAASVLTIPGTSVSGASVYTLMTFASRTGTFATVNGLPVGYTLNYNTTSITLTNSAVPEPAALAVVSMLGGMGMIRRRSHR